MSLKLKFFYPVLFLIIFLSCISVAQVNKPYYIYDIDYNEDSSLISGFKVYLYYNYDDTILIDLSGFLINNEFDNKILLGVSEPFINYIWVSDLENETKLTPSHGNFQHFFSDYPELLILTPRFPTTISVKGLELKIGNKFNLKVSFGYAKQHIFQEKLKNLDLEYPPEKLKYGDLTLIQGLEKIVDFNQRKEYIEELFKGSFRHSLTIVSYNQ